MASASGVPRPEVAGADGESLALGARSEADGESDVGPGVEATEAPWGRYMLFGGIALVVLVVGKHLVGGGHGHHWR